MTDDTIGVRLRQRKMSNNNEVTKKKYRISRVQKMTAERLKTFKGFETHTNQQAKEVIQQLET